MPGQFSVSNAISTRTTVLALLCLLFAAALQISEVSHQHSPDDVAHYCLLCKADSNHAAVDSPERPAAPPGPQLSSPVEAAVAALGYPPLPPQRAPPSHT